MVNVEGVVFVWAIQPNPTIDSLSSLSKHIFYENSIGSLFGFSLDASVIQNQSHILIGAPGVNSYTGSACDFVFNTGMTDINLNNSAFNAQCVNGYSAYGFFGGNVKFGKVKLPTGERYDVAVIASPLANAASGQIDIVIHDSLSASPFSLANSFVTEHSQTVYNNTGAMMGGVLAFVADNYMLIAGQNSNTAVVANITCMET